MDPKDIKTKDQLLDQIIDEFATSLRDFNVKLVHYIKQEEFENAVIMREKINILIENANEVLISLTGFDSKERLEQENNYIRDSCFENYDKHIKPFL